MTNSVSGNFMTMANKISSPVLARWLSAFVIGLFASLYLSRSLIVFFSTAVLICGGVAWLAADRKKLSQYPLFFPWVALFMAIFISILFAAPYPWQAPVGKLRYYLLYFPLVFVFARQPKLVALLSRLGWFLGIGIGVVAMLQYLGVGWLEWFKPNPMAPVENDPLHFHARGFTPHHNLFASVAVLLFHLLLANVLVRKLRREQLWYGLAMVFVAAAVGASFSRGAWLALIASSLVVLVYWLGKRAVVPILAVMGVVALLVAVNPAFRQRLSRLKLSQNQDRMALWGSSLRMFKESPMVGKGFHSYATYQKKFLTAQEQRDFSWLPQETHSIYLDLLAGTGLLGAFCFCWLVLSAGKNLFWALSHSPGNEDSIALLASLGAGLAVLLTNVTDSHLYSTYGGPGGVFFLALGQAVYFRYRFDAGSLPPKALN